MAEIKRGEIWLVSLDPTVGHEIKKARPAVIIQNDIGNAYSPITIIAPLTSQIKEKVYPFEAFLPKERTGLIKDSCALLNQIRAIDKVRLVKKIGRLDDNGIEKVNEALKVSLGLVSLK